MNTWQKHSDEQTNEGNDWCLQGGNQVEHILDSSLDSDQ